MLGTTMTTNNIPFGVPDPDEIARLANAFFAGWPGNAPGGGGVPPAPGGSVATAPAQGVVGDPHGPPTGKDLLVPLESPRIEEAKTPEPASPDTAAPPRTSSLATFDAFAFSPFLAPSPVQPGVRTIGIGSAGLAQDFPILGQRINGHRLIWLDNAATTQKPQCVIDRLSQFYETENSNVHRAAHTLAARATDAYEAAREKVRRFLGAGSTSEIVFVRGATEAINLVAQAWGRANVKAGDEIIITWLEHHANISFAPPPAPTCAWSRLTTAVPYVWTNTKNSSRRAPSLYRRRTCRMRWERSTPSPNWCRSHTATTCRSSSMERRPCPISA